MTKKIISRMAFSMKFFFKYCLVLLLFTLIHNTVSYKQCFAKALFVATDGSDSVTYTNNDINSPWLTPEYAVYNAQAGDTVYFRSGTYYVTTTINTKYNGNNGTELNPVSFTNYNDEIVTIDGDCNGADVFSVAKEYHHFSGMSFIGRGFTAGGGIFYVGKNISSVGFHLTDCTLTVASIESIDNTNAVKLQATRANNAVIKNCTFIGPGSSVGASGILAFRPQEIVIENNEFSEFDKGFYFKHSNSLEDLGNRFKNNYIHHCGGGIRGVSNYMLFENNLITNCTYGIYFGSDSGMGDGYVGADYNTFQHNTLHNCSLSFVYQTREEDPNKGCLHNVIENNLFMGKNQYHLYTDISADIQSNYNLYQSGDIVREYNVDYTLSAWRTENSSDANSLSGVPIFVGGASPACISDYALTSASPGYQAASDGKDIGADVSRVGVGNGYQQLTLGSGTKNLDLTGTPTKQIVFH